MRRRSDRPLRLPGLMAVAAPLLLAGLLPLPPDLSSRWGWSGTWLAPVGDPYVLPTPDAEVPAGYRVMRGVSEPSGEDRGHQGADLSNGGGGGPVRAAGNGLVVQVGGKGWNHGYGRHVVIAHHLVDGELVYSVYAHMAPGSVTVKRGELVGAGRVIGRVGMTGRATSPHLHFEVRRPEDPFARWENAPVADPIEFLSERLATEPPDTAWSRPYLEWAETAALIPPDAVGERRPLRADWWRALLLASRHPVAELPGSKDSLRATLVSLKLLDEERRSDPDAPLTWNDLSHGAPRAKERGLRLPNSPRPRDVRRRACLAQLGTATPSDRGAPIGKDRDDPPTYAAMCLLLADLAGDPPRKPKPKKPAAKGVASRDTTGARGDSTARSSTHKSATPKDTTGKGSPHRDSTAKGASKSPAPKATTPRDTTAKATPKHSAPKTATPKDTTAKAAPKHSAPKATTPRDTTTRSRTSKTPTHAS